VESNESLRVYPITAPITGVITSRHAEPGEQTSDEALFEIADFSRVWAELKVFPRDRARLKVGQPARIVAEGATPAAGTISYVAPAGERNAQSIIARVVLDNASGAWTAGQFVEGIVTVSRTPVALAVPLSAIQKFRDFDVVFAQVNDTYEVRMLDLGRRDADRAEVLGGLDPGTRYVSRNSYLIKADIEKSGASHDH
jgi:cobalt-zinc-cadmium efflux system membrane fusion protein